MHCRRFLTLKIQVEQDKCMSISLFLLGLKRTPSMAIVHATVSATLDVTNLTVFSHASGQLTGVQAVEHGITFSNSEDCSSPKEKCHVAGHFVFPCCGHFIGHPSL
jgi:hypothetical protein